MSATPIRHARLLLEVWTGTGVYGYASDDRCGGSWESTDGAADGTVGAADKKDDNWTLAKAEKCDAKTPHLYCFEQ